MEENSFEGFIKSLLGLCRNSRYVTQSEETVKGKLVDQVIIPQSEVPTNLVLH